MLRNRASVLAWLVLAIASQVAHGASCDTSAQNINQLKQTMAAAVTHESKGEYSEAIRLLESVKATGCWDSIHYVLLGQIYMKTGQYADAIQQLEAAELGGIRDIDIYTMLGEAFFKVGNNQQAVAALTKGINRRADETKTVLGDEASSVIDPTISELYTQRAGIYITQSNDKLAINDLRTAVQMDPNNTQALAQLNKLLNEIE